MSASVRGLDLDAKLPDEDKKKQEDDFFDDDDEDGGDGEEDEDDDDDMFSAPNPIKEEEDKKATAAASAAAEKKKKETSTNDDMHGLFIPDGCVKIAPQDDDTPPVPNHKESELPVGTKVWIWYPEDVFLLGADCYADFIESHCGGGAQGTVVRHSGNCVLVKFDPVHKISCPHTHTFPRAVLSKTAVTIREGKKFAAADQNAPYASIMGAKAGTKRVKPTDPSMITYTTKPSEEDAELLTVTDTTKATWDALKKSSIKEAIEALNSVKPTTPDEELEVLAVRCLLLLREDKKEEAMQLVSPLLSSTTGDEKVPFPQAWRVCLASGNFKEAATVVNRFATSKKSDKKAVEKVQLLQSIFGKVDGVLNQKSAPLKLAVDYGNMRQLVLSKKVPKNETVVYDNVLIAIPDCSNQVLVCGNCHKIIKQDTSVACPHGTGYRFCGADCAKAAWKRFLQFESEAPTRQAFRCMGGAIRMGENVVDDALRNAAFLTLRILSTSLTRVLGGTEMFPVTLTDALAELGVFPFPTSVSLDDKLAAQIDLLHGSLDAVLSDDLKKQLTAEVFRGVFRSAFVYGRSVESSDSAIPSQTAAIVPKRPTSASGAIGGARPHSRGSMTASQLSTSGRSAGTPKHSPSSSFNNGSSPLNSASRGPTKSDLFIIWRTSPGMPRPSAADDDRTNCEACVGDDGRVEVKTLRALDEGVTIVM